MNNKQQLLYKKLEEDGIKVKNIEDYKNMESVLTIECKNGHSQTKTVYEFQRDDWECLECIKEEEKNIKDKKGFILSLDAATNTTGWAVLNKYGQLLESGYFTVDKKLSLMKRIEQSLQEIEKLIKKYKIEIIALEDIQLEYNTIVFKTLAMLRGILLYQLENKLNKKVYSFSADIWRSYSHIRGSNREEKKEKTLLRAFQIYEKSFEEDEADAIFLGKYVYAQLDKTNEEVEELLNFGKENK